MGFLLRGKPVSAQALRVPPLLGIGGSALPLLGIGLRLGRILGKKRKMHGPAGWIHTTNPETTVIGASVDLYRTTNPKLETRNKSKVRNSKFETTRRAYEWSRGPDSGSSPASLGSA